MSRRKQSRVAEQADLFRPMSTGPGWLDFEQEIRDKSMKLLARLLGERRERVARDDSEASHD